MKKDNTNNSQDYLLFLIKGFAIGLANTIPGFSGASLALLTGSYEKITESIQSVDLKSLSIFIQSGHKASILYSSTKYLFITAIGITLSYFSTRMFISELFESQPVLLYSLLGGVIVISTYYVCKRIIHWDILNVLMLICGIALSYVMSLFHPFHGMNQYILALLSGFIIASRIFIPSVTTTLMFFIFVTESKLQLSSLNSPWVFIVFGLGGILGLEVASHVMNFFIKKLKNLSLAFLTGSMIGGIFLIWPWKANIPIETIKINFTAKMASLQNITPIMYSKVYNHGSQILISILFFIAGGFMVYFIRRLANINEKKLWK